MKKCVAYIDLLGFSNYVFKDFQNNDDAADQMLQEMTRVLHSTYLDTLTHPIDSYKNATTAAIAEDNSIDDIETFIPISDGVFIVGRDPVKTLPQIATYLCKCFKISSVHYREGSDPDSLTETRNILIHPDGSRSIRKTQSHPILCRGGASYGDVYYIESSYLYRAHQNAHREHMSQDSGEPLHHFTNLLGKSVIDAASFDKLDLYSGTGPRFYIHDTLFDELVARKAQDVLDFVEIETQDGSDVTLRYLLWPAFSMIRPNRFCANTCLHFDDILIPAIKLWKAYHGSDEKIRKQYTNFVKMCFHSLIAFAMAKGDDDGQDNVKIARKHLETYINKYDGDLSDRNTLHGFLNDKLTLASRITQ